jgi:hypothetical protein
VTSEAALAALLFPLAWIMVALVPLNYAFWAVAITPLVILVRDTDDIGDWGLAVTRTLNSLVGVAIALIAGFVLWPSWTRLRLPTAVERLMAEAAGPIVVGSSDRCGLCRGLRYETDAQGRCQEDAHAGRVERLSAKRKGGAVR